MDRFVNTFTLDSNTQPVRRRTVRIQQAIDSV